jgi:hypothetical protein
MLLMMTVLALASTAQSSTIHVNTTAPGVNGDAFCSLQEAIYSANFDTNTFVDPAHPGDPAITTACAAGNGNDTIALPDGAIFMFNDVASSIVDDPYNYMGPTATPIIFTKITIEGNGARLERPNPMRDFSGVNFRAFAIGFTSIVPNPGSPAVSGTGNLTIRNIYIKGFTARGGNGAGGGGGGMGAGGAIYVNGTLTVENSTFENNGARGGGGSSHVTSGPGGGGGGLSGNGGSAQGNNLFELSGELIGTLGEGGGGGGGGARGNGGINGADHPLLNGWAVENGGGGGGTLASGTAGWIYQSGDDGKGGFRCGGDGGEVDEDGHDAPCAGGGGGGGGPPVTAAAVAAAVYTRAVLRRLTFNHPAARVDLAAVVARAVLAGPIGVTTAGRANSAAAAARGKALPVTAAPSAAMEPHSTAAGVPLSAALSSVISASSRCRTVPSVEITCFTVTHLQNFRAGGSRNLRRTVRMPEEPSLQSAARSLSGTRRLAATKAPARAQASTYITHKPMR